MAGNSQVLEILEAILDSGKTPEEVCHDCPELLDEVRKRWQKFRMIDAQVKELFPETPSGFDSKIPLPPAADLPVVSGYEVLAIIGQGGMGVVYKARHLRLGRTVALKMLLAGAYATSHERTRFQREAEAVAELCHLNIIQIYDVGDFESRPYFTMEFLEGGSLAQKLAGVPQPARQAALMAAALAGAVHVAHQHGIIHRDLKPANVLLTNDGIPKIADFGLARRIEDAGGPTQSGVALGTPSYMAPEQAGGNLRQIGPAVDVYALGAILYELLTGRPPFRAETAAETVQQVLQREPALPSSLNAKVPRDLETICLKCLQKEPERRYESGRALAEDLGRFLEGRPIQARPVGPAGRFARWCRRNPAAVAVSVLLVAGVTISTWQAVRARHAEIAARKAEEAETKRAESERLAHEGTQKRLQQVDNALVLLSSIFESLDPQEIARADRPLQAILVDKLDEAVEQLEGDSIGDPQVVATLQDKLGLSLIGLGAPDKAIVLLSKAYATRQALQGPEHMRTAVTMNHLARAYRIDGQLEKALPLQEKALKLMQAHLGREDPQTINCMTNLALMYQEAGRPSEALPIQKEMLKFLNEKAGPDNIDTLTSRNNLALTYLRLGQIDQALPILEATLKIRKVTLGPSHPHTLSSINNLAKAYEGAGRLDLALTLFEEALTLCKAALGSEHPQTQMSQANLNSARNLKTAQARYRAKLVELGTDHIDTLLAHRDLAQWLLTTNHLDEAEPVLVEVIERFKSRPKDDPIRLFSIDLLKQCVTKREHAAPDSWLTFQSKSLLGAALLGVEKYATAEPLLLAGYQGMKERESTIPPNEKTRLAEDIKRLLQFYQALDKKDDAVKWQKELDALRSVKNSQSD
jgi:tetratricopeptide (TPR) repeat protein/tRNA A-37 threonylcarbamoyl transferase component Bud32